MELSHTLDSDGGVSPEAVHRNFQSLKAAFDSMGPTVRGKVTDTIALVAGNNSVRSPVRNPQGRHTVFLDANVTIYDVSVSGDTWTINASGPCNARFLFF